MKYSQSTTKAGFTLLELMVVITIIGLMATMVLAALASSRGAARDASRLQAVKEFQKALELYRNANAGNFPCATANPACAAAGSAAGAEINVGSNQVTSAVSSFYRPQLETILSSVAVAGSASLTTTAASILYRVGSTNGTETSPDRGTYTILLRREQTAGVIPANTWCAISAGSGHSAWIGMYPNCF